MSKTTIKVLSQTVKGLGARAPVILDANMRGITLRRVRGRAGLGELSQPPAAWHGLNLVYRIISARDMSVKERAVYDESA